MGAGGFRPPQMVEVVNETVYAPPTQLVEVINETVYVPGVVTDVNLGYTEAEYVLPNTLPVMGQETIIVEPCIKAPVFTAAYAPQPVQAEMIGTATDVSMPSLNANAEPILIAENVVLVDTPAVQETNIVTEVIAEEIIIPDAERSLPIINETVVVTEPEVVTEAVVTVVTEPEVVTETVVTVVTEPEVVTETVVTETVVTEGVTNLPPVEQFRLLHNNACSE